MCRDCGCEEGNERAYFGPHEHDHDHDHDHDHHHDHGHHHHVHAQPGQEIHVHVHHHYYGHAPSHGHGHSHDHDHDHNHHHDHADTRRVELETKVLALNDEAAAKNRAWLAERGVRTVNLISSPGTGKTLLLEKTLEALNGTLPAAVLVGDQQTDNDAKRLEGKGAPVRQIETRSSCHLNAEQVARFLPEVAGEGVKLLFVENVGNLVCPAAFDLGEEHKIALLSVTEGEDKPLKYPVLFHDAPVVVITKTDLVPHLDWDRGRCLAAIRAIRPDAKVIELSAKTGEGMGEWLEYLRGL